MRWSTVMYSTGGVALRRNPPHPRAIMLNEFQTHIILGVMAIKNRLIRLSIRASNSTIMVRK
jgi:hypothetical protein